MKGFIQVSLRREFRSKALVVLVGFMVVVGLTPGAASAANPLSLGFDTWAGQEQSSDLGLAASDGASTIRVNVAWSNVAPATRPDGFVASDPASTGYDWSSVDEAVRMAAEHGLSVAMTIYTAPSWAEGADRPSAVEPGSWRVNAQDLGQFAKAAALRYNGSFADPTSPGKSLPAVRMWQVWNEPNLDFYLSPQWVKGANGKFTPAAPVIYRSMLNSVYSAVKSVSSSDRVIMAGTAPYGDQPGRDPLGRERTPPVAFYRDVFCLSTSLKPACSTAVHLDGVDHHPYDAPSQGPNWHAVNKDDASYPDMYKITGALNAGLRYGHVLPKGPKTIWASEIGWTTNPPTSGGVPVVKAARWFEQALYVLWKQGVSTIMNTEIRDQPPSANVFQDGLYYANGKPKTPLITAYRFPFVTRRVTSTSIQAWGRAPAAGRVAIQVLEKGRWKTLRTLTVARHQVFSTTIKLKGDPTLRSRVGSQTSLTWKQSA